jgi:hypothetical protein
VTSKKEKKAALAAAKAIGSVRRSYSSSDKKMDRYMPGYLSFC